MSGGGGDNIVASAVPIGLAIAATVATDGAAAPMLGEALGAEGVGAAVLGSSVIGAGTGALGSVLSGRDPLTGALTGGVTGAATSGIMSAFNAPAGTFTPDVSGVSSGVGGSTIPASTNITSPSQLGINPTGYSDSPVGSVFGNGSNAEIVGADGRTYNIDQIKQASGSVIPNTVQAAAIPTAAVPPTPPAAVTPTVPTGETPTPNYDLTTNAADQAGYSGINQAGASNQLPGTAPYSPTPPKDAGIFGTGITGKQALAGGAGALLLASILNSQKKYAMPTNTAWNANLMGPSPNYKALQVPQPTPYVAKYPGMAEGGIAKAYAVGGPVEQMSNQNAVGDNPMYPQAGVQNTMGYSNPINVPLSTNIISGVGDTKVDPYTGAQQLAAGGTPQFVAPYAPVTTPQSQLDAIAAANKAAAVDATNQAKTYSKGAQGLYEYYLGRQASPDELKQWSTIDPNAMATSADARYFNQFTGNELGQTGYQQTGMAPFRGVPAQQMVQQPQMQRQVDQGGGGAAGGLMPQDLSYAAGGITMAYADGGHLGGYSDGGRMLKGPGDGMSDSIPASIQGRQPARLADSEFVVPADVVSHLGNGSSDAGAKKLYAMMDRVRQARTGTKKQGKQIKAEKYLPK